MPEELGRRADRKRSDHASTWLRSEPKVSSSSNDADNESSSSDEDVMKLTPENALKQLCSHLNALAAATGDVALNEILVPRDSREESENSLASMVESRDYDHIEADEELKHQQANVLIRKFFSKDTPPISLEDYMHRLHRYCPMSTAVYLATVSYISRIAVHEKLILVAPRNVHRLVLGGLRVATKMFEDLSYSHSRFAKVGGVTERELARLEIYFCFLMDFELKVDIEMMRREVANLV